MSDGDHRIDVSAEVGYDITRPTSFAFSVAAARTPHQTVVSETITFEPERPFSFAEYGEAGSHQLIRVDADAGSLTMRYEATVLVQPSTDAAGNLDEASFGDVPADVLPYCNPSRYCESDRLVGLATRLFGDLAPGYTRVRAISEWVREEIVYAPGSTGVSTGAADVLLQRAGVCRDFAHVAIALCRALGIPARYVSGYGIGVEPPDFHGFLEVFLDGGWWLFDPTGMTRPDGLVRIGYGRDAADAPFATFVGGAALTHKRVSASGSGTEASDGAGPDDRATSTA